MQLLNRIKTLTNKDLHNCKNFSEKEVFSNRIISKNNFLTKFTKFFTKLLMSQSIIRYQKLLASKKITLENKVARASSKPIHAQSAMEYLITYGWAILVLAIVLSLLFAFGFFNGNNAVGQICSINQGFDCINYYMSTNGVAVFTISQTSASYINVTEIGCSSDPNNQHLTPLSTPSNQIYLPYATAYNFSVQCYTPSGPASLQLGQVFYGTLYISYVNDVNSFEGAATGKITIKPSITGISNGGGTSGSGTESYIPVTLTNYQSNTVSQNFQQMIYFNPQSYSANEMANLSNIEFTADAPIGTSGNVPLNAWIESGASSSASNTVMWINLGSNTIGAAGTGSNTLTIYMNFLSNNNPVTQGYTGYAPQLWCASGCFQTGYAQYDDGANVFLLYFNGNTILSDFTSPDTLSQASVTGPTGTTINVISITGYASNFGFVYTAKSITDQAVISESSSQQNGLGAGGLSADNGQVSILDKTSSTNLNAISVDMGYGSAYFVNDYFVGGARSEVNQQGSANANWHYASVTYAGSSATSWSGYIAPQLYSTSGGYSGSVSDNPFSSSTSLYLGLIGNVNSADEWQTYINWMRARAYPPNDIMPSFSFGNYNNQLMGSVSLSSTQLFLNNAETLTAMVSGGTSPYTYQWYEEAPGAGSFSAISGGTSQSYLFSTTSKNTQGIYKFYAEITDSNGVHVNSNTASINVIQELGQYAYVTNYAGGNVVIINTATNTVVNSIPGSYSNPDGVAFSPDGSYAYVVNWGTGYIDTINALSNTILGSFYIGYPQDQGVAFSPSGTYAYGVINDASVGPIAYIENNAVSSVISINAGLGCPLGVAFSKTGAYAYIVNMYSTNNCNSGTGNVIIMNTATNTVINSITQGLDNPAGIAIAPSGTYGYITNRGSNNVVIFNTATNTVIGAITPSDFSTPSFVAFDPTGTFAYVANYGSNNVVIINTATNTVVNSITNGFNGPVGVAFIP